MKGSLEVICGPMFSGKSEELIRRLRREKIAKKRTVVFKPVLDDRYSKDNVVSHSGIEIEAIPLKSAFEIMLLFDKERYDIVGVDEVQFFSEDIITYIKVLVDQGVRVIVSGLDQDFREEPFSFMGYLLAWADKVDKLTAICIKCGGEATTTQRLVNGEPALYSGETILVGAAEAYEARCRNCHERG